MKKLLVLLTFAFTLTIAFPAFSAEKQGLTGAEFCNDDKLPKKDHII